MFRVLDGDTAWTLVIRFGSPQNALYENSFSTVSLEVMVPKCRLCLLDRKLCQSHIVPEFLYTPLYNSDRELMAISGRGNKSWKPLNKGIWEHLLCSDCEGHLNHEYEQPFQEQWAGSSALPNHMANEAAYEAVFDYLTFKLFHLSILFKASVSSHATFRTVSLGKHEERIREMLLFKNPGQAEEYPIIAFAILGAQGEVERRIISQPIAARYEGHHVYGQIYGGAMWWISTSSHSNIAFSRGGLQQSGHMTFVAEPWSEIGVMQDAGVALKRNTGI